MHVYGVESLRSCTSKKVPVSIVSAFSPRILIPWLLFVIVIAACIGVIIQQRVRNAGTPLDCIMGAWSEWTGCDDCTSMGVRIRGIAQQAETGGIPCKAFSRAETQSCAILLQCDNSACQYTPWTPWTACPVTCFRGVTGCDELPSQFRMRSIARPAFPGGLPCDWTTLVEQQPCLPPKECEVDQSCVAAADSNDDCIPCPSVGCTVSDQFWTYCTRSILISKTGLGEPCTSDQLIYSHTCPLPDCTADCQSAYGSGQFTTCSQPCGTGWHISAESCPEITTEACNTYSCPIGTMVLSNTSCTFATSKPCDTLSECLALCASDPTCNVVQGGFRGSATCSPSANTTWVWDSAATTCVPPTWEMVNATCLYVCEQNPSYSTQRGIVFHFNDSNSLSCPITPSLLSSSGACPTTTTPVAALIAALWHGPMGGSHLVSLTDPYIPLEFTVSCPESSDCVYQSWSDAPLWSQCTSGCVNGGIRHRQRAIVAPAYFLGIPCDVSDQNEYSVCNLRTTVTSATDMGCSGGRNARTVSDVVCHELWQANSHSAMQLHTRSHMPGSEIFLYSNTIPLTTDTILAYTPPGGCTIATQQQVVDAYANGFQACAPGWFATPTLTAGVLRDPERSLTVVCPTYAFGSTFSAYPWTLFAPSISGHTCTYVSSIGLPSFSFLGSTTCPWGYEHTNGTCSTTQDAACADGYYYTMRDGGGCAAPLGSAQSAAPKYAVTRINHQSTSVCPYSNGIVTSDTAYVFLVGDKMALTSPLPFFTPYGPSSLSALLTPQVYHDERVCTFFLSRTDALLNERVCSAASLTVMYDKPCGTARDCSYTAWGDATSCGTCIPPATKIQTRSIAHHPSEGGRDCTDPLSTATDCFGPPCTSTANACSYAPFPSVPNCSSAFFPAAQAYFSEWSTATINAYADYGISNLFPALSSMSNGSSVTNDIAWALNAQCAPALCVPSITGTGSFTGMSWAMNENFGGASGWETSACAVSDGTLKCLRDRIASYPVQDGSYVGSYVYNLSVGTWSTISMCPYELGCCSWSECSGCAGGNGSRTQTVSAPVTGGVSCGLARTLTRNCPYLDMVPTCANSLTCPVTTDGTPCNSHSGLGVCALSQTTFPTPPFYYCSCTGANVGRACNNGCPIGSNGLTCSDHGMCSLATEQCSCTSEWFGPRCDQRGPASLGMIEMLLYQARMDWNVYNSGDSIYHVTVTNSLQCDVESNAVCAGAQFTGNDVAGGKFNPYTILELDYTSEYPMYANICVNDADAGSSWVPPSLLLATYSHVCQNLGAHPFEISARFTSHSLVPVGLHGRSFYTSCNVLYSQPYATVFGSLTQHLPCQYATSCVEGAHDDALFILNGYENSLNSFCQNSIIHL